MKSFHFAWEEVSQRSVEIEAKSLDEAIEKWNLGDYKTPDVDDQDIQNNEIYINGKLYSLSEVVQ